MEVIWNGNINKVPFEYVDVGHTFIFGTAIYLKIVPITQKDDININAINIERGSYISFFDDEYVTPVVGKFVMN